MKRFFCIFAFSATLCLYGQNDPRLLFNDINVFYGYGLFELNASSPVSQGLITYSIISGQDIVKLTGSTAAILNAGSATIQAVIQANGEYNGDTASATITVLQKDIGVRVQDLRLTYGDYFTEDRIELQFIGNTAYGEPETIITNRLIISCEASFSSVPSHGSYKISIEYDNSQGNYNVTTVPGFLEVSRKPLNLIVDFMSRYYGDKDPLFTYRFPSGGFVNGETKDDLVPEPQLGTEATIFSPVGNYTIRVLNEDEQAWNYDLIVDAGILEIQKSNLIVIPVPITRYYSEPDPGFEGATVNGFKNGEGPAIIDQFGNGVNAAGNTIFGSGIELDLEGLNSSSPPGVWPINITASLSAHNYVFEYQYGTYTIVEAPVSIDIRNLFKLQGHPNPVLKVELQKDASLTQSKEHIIQNLGFDMYGLQTLCTIGSSSGDYMISYGFNPDERSSNYQVTLSEGVLTVYDSANFDPGFIHPGACRDSPATITVSTTSINPEFEWLYSDQNGTFAFLDNSISQVLGILPSSINTPVLEFSHAEEYLEDYAFRCRVTSTFREDPLDLQSELFVTIAESDDASIFIKDTPPYAKVELKGGSILICRDLNPRNVYQWGKGGATIAGATNPYLDISSDPGDMNLYWIETEYPETQCKARSSLLTQNGFISELIPFIPGFVNFNLYPQPAAASAGINVEISNHEPFGEYTIRIYNQFGRKIGSEIFSASGSTAIKHFISFDNALDPGIYFLEFRQATGRSMEKFVVHED